MEIDIVGEDTVTQEIIERILQDYRKDLIVRSRLPARGGLLKKLAPNFNALESPIFLLTDLDNYLCAPTLIADWLNNAAVNPKMLFRIALEESETWLMADREGFSNWIGADINLIPTPVVVDNKGSMEIIFPLKPSLYMMMNIAANSNNPELREFLTPVVGAKKGRGYNAAIVPFIKNIWNIENAASSSTSLRRTIDRVLAYNP